MHGKMMALVSLLCTSANLRWSPMFKHSMLLQLPRT